MLLGKKESILSEHTDTVEWPSMKKLFTWIYSIYQQGQTAKTNQPNFGLTIYLTEYLVIQKYVRLQKRN